MCYSAQIISSYQKYLRMTGAEMDLRQFLEIYGLRAMGRTIRIPRALGRNFDDPKSPLERAIKEAIDQFRASAIARVETEIFTQKRRLADAERSSQSGRPRRRPRASASRRTRSSRLSPGYRY